MIQLLPLENTMRPVLVRCGVKTPVGRTLAARAGHQTMLYCCLPRTRPITDLNQRLIWRNNKRHFVPFNSVGSRRRCEGDWPNKRGGGGGGGGLAFGKTFVCKRVFVCVCGKGWKGRGREEEIVLRHSTLTLQCEHHLTLELTEHTTMEVILLKPVTNITLEPMLIKI